MVDFQPLFCFTAVASRSPTCILVVAAATATAARDQHGVEDGGVADIQQRLLDAVARIIRPVEIAAVDQVLRMLRTSVRLLWIVAAGEDRGSAATCGEAILVPLIVP
jgi:hypothetical protein